MLESNKIFSNIRLKYISFLVACLCLTDAWSYGQRNAGIDFYQYWAVGQKISQAKKINVYSNNIRRSWGTEFLERANNSKSQRFLMAANYRKFLDTTASPFLYSLFGNLSPKDYDRAITIYRFICMVCVVFSFIMLGHLLRFPFVISMLFLVLFTLYFEPYRSDLRVANVNQIQLGALALFLWFQSRNNGKGYFLGGIVLGSIIAFKINLIFIFLMLGVSWLIKGQMKKMILCYFGVAVSVFAAVIFSSIVFGSMQCWFDWLGVGATPFCNHPVDDGNYSLNRLIFDWLGMDVARFLIIGLISMAALFIWLGRRKESSNGLRNSNSDSLEDFPIVGVGCLIYLLSGPLVWEHYYILTIPSVLFMLRPRYDDQSLAGRRNTIISRCLVIYSMIMLSLVSGQAFFKTDIIYSFAITIVIGTILLFILTMKELLENAL